VHDAVRGGPNGGRHVVERLQRLGRLVGGDDRELQASRAGVDDEDPAQ
jgi:hypothetical protein